MLYGPAELAKPGFNAANSALGWALSGFANSTVWLIFAAFMFALGYDRTGLGRRISLVLVKAMGRRTLTLGYAVTFADALLAPFTPSNTARSGGTIFPVIKNLPPLYESLPNDPSARRIGWLSHVDGVRRDLRDELDVRHRARAEPARARVRAEDGERRHLAGRNGSSRSRRSASASCSLTPLLVYWIYPPEVKAGGEVPAWAAKELHRLGGLAPRAHPGGLVVVALALWIFGDKWINATTVALVVDHADAASPAWSAGTTCSATSRRGTRSSGSRRWSRSPTG